MQRLQLMARVRMLVSGNNWLEGSMDGWLADAIFCAKERCIACAPPEAGPGASA